MIGDSAGLLHNICEPSNILGAFRYALRDRLQDHYYDPIEIEYASQHEKTILAEIARELKDPECYKPRPAYGYFPPKSDLCVRRMVYIPFKDLVVRYACLTVFSNLLDQQLSQKCFANRRAHGEAAQNLFLQEFASLGWPRFCKWQRKCAANPAFRILLRTDISAFYDSVCHKYLIRSLENQLAIQAGSKLMKFFQKVLRVPVICYSHLTGKAGQAETMYQGLAIGNNTEGVLANLYLRTVDDGMAEIDGIAFGRYNDDMRIFAKDRGSANRAILVLQELLLAKNLNLNSSKTKPAEGSWEINKLRSKAYEAYDYDRWEDEFSLIRSIPISDRPFDEFNRDFVPGQILEKQQDAKDFCHFLSRKTPLEERLPSHVDMLRLAMTRWPGCGRHASWRLVETIARDACPTATRAHAVQVLLDCLSDRDIAYYVKYRLLHHLAKPRGGLEGNRNYFDKLGSRARNKIKKVLPTLLNEKAFELNIIALYVLKVLGASHSELERVVGSNAPKPVGTPIRNALFLAAKAHPEPVNFALAELSESDGSEDYY